MQKVIVRLPGAGSLVVESEYPPKFIFKMISEHFTIIQKFDVKEAKRGAPKKVMPEDSGISEGAAG